MVAIDLDGTLLDGAQQIDPATGAALRALSRRGIEVVIASARPPRSVRHLYNELQLVGPQINYNGALVWHERERRVIDHRPMRSELVAEMARLARDAEPGVVVQCEVLDRLLTDRVDDRYTTQTSRLFPPDLIAPLSECHAGPVTKLMLLGETQALAEVKRRLLLRFAGQVIVLQGDPDLLQISSITTGKAVALKTLVEASGISAAEVLALGDAENDVAMLQYAGVGVAMGNAAPLVKEVADWIAPTNQQQGVLAALRRYGLA